MTNYFREIFKIPVGVSGRRFRVYDIPDKEHEGPNGEPKSWWLYYSDKELFEGDGPDLTDINDPELIPWHASMERLCWDIRFRQMNTVKYKWDYPSFRSTTVCDIFCNGTKVYSFITNGGEKGMSFAMAKVQYLQTMLTEHPYNFLNPKENEGRKICYKGLPATVRVHQEEPWNIGIVPDYTEIPKEEWWEELKSRESKHTVPDNDFDALEEEHLEEDKRNDYINWGDALSDAHIFWFRK